MTSPLVLGADNRWLRFFVLTNLTACPLGTLVEAPTRLHLGLGGLVLRRPLALALDLDALFVLRAGLATVRIF